MEVNTHILEATETIKMWKLKGGREAQCSTVIFRNGISLLEIENIKEKRTQIKYRKERVPININNFMILLFFV